MQGTQLQLDPQNWPGAVARFPSGTPFMVIDGVQRVPEAKAHNSSVFAIVRHYVSIEDQDALLDSITDLNDARVKGRAYLDTFVDGSFLTLAHTVDAITGFNEYSHNGDVTPAQMDWMAYEYGAAYVMHDEHHYYKRTLWVRGLNEAWDQLRDEHPNELGHIRLISVNAAPGNSIPLEWARIVAQYGGILGHHPYTAITDGQIRFDDGQWYSGRWRMDDAYFREHGIKVEWLGTEAGAIGTYPDGGMDTFAGWREGWVLGADMDRYIAMLQYRLKMIEAWNAQHGNRYRGDALFLSGAVPGWKPFDIDAGQLVRVATEAAAPVPAVITTPPPPPEPPEPDPATPSFVVDYVDELPTDTTSPDYPYDTRPLSAIESVIIHHSVGDPSNPPESINIGHQRRGWPRIGYHFYITGDGTCYKTNLLTTHSYHAGTANRSSIGVCLAGDFTDVHPTDKQLAVARQLTQWLNDVLGEKELLKHRDVSATQCPGNTWEEWFDELTALPPPDVNYVVVANLLRQDATIEEAIHVLEETYPQRQSVLYSADDAARLVAPGLSGSRVKVWGTWPGIGEWLNDRGVQHVEYHTFPSESPIVTFPVGTEDEALAATDDWPGEWIDANPYGNKYWLRDSYSYHTGADLNLNKPYWDADRGAPVVSIADGIVTYAGHLTTNWGNVIVIDHGEFVSRYAALEEMFVRVGQQVYAGEKIATIGRHKEGEPYHLHFDISTTRRLIEYPADWPGLTWSRIERDYVDPLQFILERK